VRPRTGKNKANSNTNRKKKNTFKVSLAERRLFASFGTCYSSDRMIKANHLALKSCALLHLEQRPFLCTGHCERSVRTVFQLSSLDAIYSQDKEKVREVGYYPMLFVFAHGPRAAKAR
jgi:hypothetical protein